VIDMAIAASWISISLSNVALDQIAALEGIDGVPF